MGKNKKRYRALKDDVKDLIIAIKVNNKDEINEMVTIIEGYYFKQYELENISKTIEEINLYSAIKWKGEQDATQL